MSFLKSIQQRLRVAASEIREPTIGVLELDRITAPTIGWLDERDYQITNSSSWSINIPGLEMPTHSRQQLLSVETIVSEALGIFVTTTNVSNEVFNPIQKPNACDLFQRVEGRNFSLDLFRKLGYARELETAECLSLLEGRSVASANLHVALTSQPKIGGKQYSEAPAKEEKIKARLFNGQKHQSGGELPAKDKKTKRQNTDQNDIWNLLLPVLQKPINLNLGIAVELPITLYAYQTAGVEFLLENNEVLLGDDMGTGKTVQTSVAMRMLFQMGKVRSALIVCPLSVIPNWARELAKLADNLTVTVVRGDKDRRISAWRQPTHVWLTTFDTLRNDLMDVIRLRRGQFDLIAVDEAQRIKNASSGVAKAIRTLRAERHWGLTGTPLENHLEDVFALFEFIKPGLFEPRNYWPQEVQEIIKPYFLRRRKVDVLKDLPTLVQHPRWLQLDEEQRKSYDELEERGVLELHERGEALTAQSVIVLLNRLKQVCNRCPRTGESSKLEWVRESLEKVAAEGDKALIFSQYKADNLPGTFWLEKELAEFGPLNYSSASSDAKRRELLAQFKDDPTKKVFLGHPKTAGLGLNELVAANYVIHFDHWWNPAVMNQATARAHRPGQTKTVFAYDLWIEETYEQAIFEILKEKQGLYDEIIDSISNRREQEGSLAFQMADRLFAKYGLSSVGR